MSKSNCSNVAKRFNRSVDKIEGEFLFSFFWWGKGVMCVKGFGGVDQSLQVPEVSLEWM